MRQETDEVKREHGRVQDRSPAVDERGSSLVGFSTGGSHRASPFPKIRSHPARNSALAVTTAKLGRSYFIRVSPAARSNWRWSERRWSSCARFRPAPSLAPWLSA